MLVSAHTGEGISALIDRLSAEFERRLAEVELLVPYVDGGRLAELHELAGDLEREDTPEGVRVLVRLPAGVAPGIKRGISIYGTRLYVPTSDSHIVALDVKTGKVIWDQPVADFKKGYRVTGGPLVARGKVMIGTTGRAEGGNYIAALDAETGKEASHRTVKISGGRISSVLAGRAAVASSGAKASPGAKASSAARTASTMRIPAMPAMSASASIPSLPSASRTATC